MASRRFFAYDPYDYYYASPYHYTNPYYQYQQPVAPRGAGGFFPDATPKAVTMEPRPRVHSSRPVSIPVHFVGSDPEQERGTTRMTPAAGPAMPRKRAPSTEEAALRVQAAARGFLARRSVRAVREMEREAEEVGGKITREAEALRGDARVRIAVGEALMKMLLRLDTVRGTREYRRRVTKRVLALQDAIDALEAPPAVVTAADQENESAVTTDESAGASEVTDVVERSGKIKAEAVEAAAEMEVDADGADGEPAEAGEIDASNLASDKPEDLAAEGEWEMVTEEPEPATCHEAPQHQEPAGTANRTAEETNGAGLDTAKVMEMVATLCERSAQQCVVIRALAQRVDALERAVRRVEDAERRRRRAKKLRKEGKGSKHGKCYSD